MHQELVGAIQRYDDVAGAFRHGGGVPAADLHPDVWAGTGRFTTQWHQNMLVQQWLPLLPDTTASLLADARVANVLCGSGQAPDRPGPRLPRGAALLRPLPTTT